MPGTFHLLSHLISLCCKGLHRWENRSSWSWNSYQAIPQSLPLLYTGENQHFPLATCRSGYIMELCVDDGECLQIIIISTIYSWNVRNIFSLKIPVTSDILLDLSLNYIAQVQKAVLEFTEPWMKHIDLLLSYNLLKMWCLELNPDFRVFPLPFYLALFYNGEFLLVWFSVFYLTIFISNIHI